MRAAILVAATLSALLSVPAASASAPAARGVDITPPAAGSCHDLTFDEGMGSSDPDPAVDCAAAHTSITLAVVTFGKAPDWGDSEAIYRRIDGPCSRALATMFAGHIKALQASAYGPWTFYPTKAQRDAGAKWVRCDVALVNGSTMLQLPTDGDPTVGRLPLDDSIARCRRGRSQGAFVTGCAGTHAYRMTDMFKHKGSAYPGYKKLQRWTYRRCHARLGRSLGLYEFPTPGQWSAHLRYSLCLKKTKA
jgi:hypothetical protein